MKAPKIPQEPIEGVTLETVKQLVNVCDRDVAIFLCLFETGARAAKFLAINLDDINQAAGEILIRSGKGRKPRFVYLGHQSRKALRKYLKHRQDNSPVLWVTHPRYGLFRLYYSGLKMILKRKAKKGGYRQACPT